MARLRLEPPSRRSALLQGYGGFTASRGWATASRREGAVVPRHSRTVRSLTDDFAAVTVPWWASLYLSVSAQRARREAMA